MQTLTPAVFLCHAEADAPLAADIAAFLERGADIRVFLEEGRISPGGDLAAKAREGRMADIVVVLFSRDSMPSRWPRAQWEDPLVTEPAAEGVRIAFVRCDDCVPPRVLSPMFDYDGLNVRGLRKLKRWVRDRAATYRPPEVDRVSDIAGLEADLEILGIAIADRPGMEIIESAAVAFEFARAYAEDFDEVVRIEAGGRTPAGLAGDLATQLGMRLEGDLASNLERLQEFCSERRLLVIMDGIPDAPFQLHFGGRCSTLIVTEAGPETNADPLRPIQLTLTSGDRRTDWPALCVLARQGRRVAREQGRIAELFEIMQLWHEAAGRYDDRAALNESARELVWILEGWGRAEEAERLEYQRTSEFDEQMRLF